MRTRRAPGRAQPAPRRRTRLGGARAAARRRRHLRLLRALLARAVPAPGHAAAVDRRARSHVDGHASTSRPALAAGNGRRSSRCRTSATGTSPARGSPGRATRSRSSSSRSSRRSSSSGSSAPAPRSACTSIAARAGRRRGGARARCAPTRSCACSATATSPATASRSSSSASAPRCRRAGDARAAHRRAAPPGGRVLPAPTGVTTSCILDPIAGRARRAASATTSRASPRTSPTASRS